MARARGDRARMFHPHEIAVPAVAAGKGDRAVGGGMDRRAVARADIDPVVHPRIAEDRMAAPAEACGDVSADGHPTALRGWRSLAARVEPLVADVDRPAHPQYGQAPWEE